MNFYSGEMRPNFAITSGSKPKWVAEDLIMILTHGKTKEGKRIIRFLVNETKDDHDSDHGEEGDVDEIEKELAVGVWGGSSFCFLFCSYWQRFRGVSLVADKVALSKSRNGYATARNDVE